MSFSSSGQQCGGYGDGGRAHDRRSSGWTRFVPYGMVVGVVDAVLLDGVLNDRLGVTDGFGAAVATGLGLFALAFVLWSGGARPASRLGTHLE
jgi:hypothetical protein